MQAAAKIAHLSQVMEDAETLRDFIGGQGGFTKKEADPPAKDWDLHPVQQLRQRYYQEDGYQVDAKEFVINWMADMVIEAEPKIQGKAIKTMMALPAIQQMKGSDLNLRTMRNVLNDMIPLMDPSTQLAGIQAMADLPVPENVDYLDDTISDLRELVLAVPEARRWAGIQIVADSAAFKAYQQIDPEDAQRELIEMVVALPDHDSRHLGSTEVVRRDENNKLIPEKVRLFRLPDDEKGRPVLALDSDYSAPGMIDDVLRFQARSLMNLEQDFRNASYGYKAEPRAAFEAEKEAQRETRRKLAGFFVEVAEKRERDDPKLAAELLRAADQVRPKVDPVAADGPNDPAA